MTVVLALCADCGQHGEDWIDPARPWVCEPCRNLPEPYNMDEEGVVSRTLDEDEDEPHVCAQCGFGEFYVRANYDWMTVREGSTYSLSNTTIYVDDVVLMPDVMSTWVCCCNCDAQYTGLDVEWL